MRLFIKWIFLIATVTVASAQAGPVTNLVYKIADDMQWIVVVKENMPSSPKNVIEFWFQHIGHKRKLIATRVAPTGFNEIHLPWPDSWIGATKIIRFDTTGDFHRNLVEYGSFLIKISRQKETAEEFFGFSLVDITVTEEPEGVTIPAIDQPKDYPIRKVNVIPVEDVDHKYEIEITDAKPDGEYKLTIYKSDGMNKPVVELDHAVGVMKFEDQPYKNNIIKGFENNHDESLSPPKVTSKTDEEKKPNADPFLDYMDDPIHKLTCSDLFRRPTLH